jgi:hypothetical protein
VSVKVMSAVIDRYPVGGSEMLLALVLADVARDDGRLMIVDSVAELARKTRQTDRGVQRQLRRMENSGWLRVVRASDGGRGRASIYSINDDWINGGELQAHSVVPKAVSVGRDVGCTRANAGNHETPTLAPQNPDSGSGIGVAETPTRPTQNPDSRSGAYRPTRPNTEIPPNPPLGGKPRQSKREGKGPSEPMTLVAWLSTCKARGEKAIPADDPVYDYAEQVGISVELLHLHWAEFKVRRGESAKRQRDWRQTFRNSVRDNWFRLWWIPPGKPAEITSAGRQAMAAHEAQSS